MNHTAPVTPIATAPGALPSPSSPGLLARWWHPLCAQLGRLPHTLVAALARFSLAATFWLSGQTKIEGLAINLVEGRFQLGWPRLSASAVDLFRDEYRLPILPPESAALLAASAEHALPLLLLLGLGTRFAALGLLGMTIVIQLLVYPGAYATHGIWAAALLLLIAHGPGAWSVDHVTGWDRVQPAR
jgi:putative oxidoreductase